MREVNFENIRAPRIPNQIVIVRRLILNVVTMTSFLVSSPSDAIACITGSVFEFGGKREMVNRARAEELLASTAHITDPATIRLSNKSFGIDAAEAIAERLSSFKNVRIADISDIIAGRPEEEALRVLRTICAALAGCDLIEVNVSDNAFGLKGVDACRDILVGKNTEKFYFCNNGLSAEAVHGIADLFAAGSASSSVSGKGEAQGAESAAATGPPVRVLHFYNNMCGNGGAVGLARIVRSLSRTLRDLRFSATRSSGEGCLALAEVT
jgi:Ran GTPase-activating protein (RanGAP) involved in mRNA processing and transport